MRLEDNNQWNIACYLIRRTIVFTQTHTRNVMSDRISRLEIYLEWLDIFISGKILSKANRTKSKAPGHRSRKRRLGQPDEKLGKRTSDRERRGEFTQREII